jgi:hypothetical protein
MKDVIGTNSGAFGKTGAGTSEPESSAFLVFLNFLRMPYLAMPGNRMCNFSRALQQKSNSPQSEFRAKSYARFKEDSLN